MTYIPPEERQPDSDELGEWFVQCADMWEMVNSIAKSHAVLDKLAADLATALEDAKLHITFGSTVVDSALAAYHATINKETT